MGKAVVNRNVAINITESARLQQANFTQQNPTRTIGPEPVSDTSSSGDAVAVSRDRVHTVYTWKAMTTGDAGLKNALYEFINTTKEGVKVAPDLTRGREKKMVFNFYGSMGKSIKPGEIGQFEVIFSYPPTVGTAGGSTTTTPPVVIPGPGQA